MPCKLVALGCTLAGAVGVLAVAPAAAGAASLPKPAISLSAPARGYAAGDKIKLTVTLHAKRAGQLVSLYATPAGGPRTLVTRGKVNAQGKLFPAYTLTRTTTFTVVFAGGAGNAPARASRTVGAAARVRATITGSVKTTRIGGVGYRVFGPSGTLTLHSRVTPDARGQCLKPETEQFDAGSGWDADTKYGCDTLDGASHDAAPFSLAQAAGDRYRIRADYVAGARDHASLSADSGWLYFEVVS